MSTLNSAQEAVDAVANEAIYAALQQTFAVGGAIINNATGEVIAALHNNVLIPFPGNGATYFLPMTRPPTASGNWWTVRQPVDVFGRRREQVANSYSIHGNDPQLRGHALDPDERPQPHNPQAVMTFGAYGSTMEGPGATELSVQPAIGAAAGEDHRTTDIDTGPTCRRSTPKACK